MQTQSERQEMAPPDYETDRKDIVSEIMFHIFVRLFKS